MVGQAALQAGKARQSLKKTHMLKQKRVVVVVVVTPCMTVFTCPQQTEIHKWGMFRVLFMLLYEYSFVCRVTQKNKPSII